MFKISKGEKMTQEEELKLLKETKTRTVSLCIGDVDVMISDDMPDIEQRALKLIDILLKKYRKEIAFSLNPENEEDPDSDEKLKDKDGSKKLKVKAKTRSFSAAYA